MARSSRFLIVSRTSIKIGFLLTLLLCGLAGVSCQDGNKGGGNQPAPQNTDTPTSTPISEPGHWGTKPPNTTPVVRRITDTSGKVESTPTPCDKIYQVQVELSKFGVTCGTYNMTTLNDEAQKLADAQLNKIQCPAGAPCTLHHAFYSYWTADCKGTAATVKIKGYAMCATNTSDPNSTDPGVPVPADKTKPTDKVTPAPVTMTGGENVTFGAVDNGDYIKAEIASGSKNSAGTTLACPSNTLNLFTYKEKEPQIPSIGVGNYTPYIQRAILQAMMTYNQYSCPAGCTKLPFIPLYTQWSISGEYVVVEVYFMLTCQ